MDLKTVVVLVALCCLVYQTNGQNPPGSNPPGSEPPGGSPPGSNNGGVPKSEDANGNAQDNQLGGDGKNSEKEEKDHSLPGTSGTRSRQLVCEGSSAVLSCPTDLFIFMDYALWGRSDDTTCNADDSNITEYCNSGANAVNYMIDLCDGKESCEVEANINVFGDPCDNRTSLYLMVEFTCRRKVYDSLMCENSGKLPLTCPENQIIQTGQAFWGRANLNTTCAHPTATPATNCSGNDTSFIFWLLCDGKRDCEVEATSFVFGDPCPDANKYLTLSYTCEACENKENDVDCDMYAMEGECLNNPGWMQDNCRKSCSKCDSDKQVCENRWFNDTHCDEWANKGDCDTNPVWMLAFCKASCIGCNKKTKCADKVTEPADSCFNWAQDSECIRNVYWMFPNCTSECFGCERDKTSIIQCKNRHFSQKNCDAWAAFGQCERNAGWMIPNCLQSCLGCTEDPVCSNKFPDQQCHEWARVGECERNVVWMHQNCWKACMQCEGARECVNKQEDEATCQHWADLGMIASQPKFMTRECWKTISGCEPKKTKQDCVNKGGSDVNCNFWAGTKQCSGNAGYMYPNCFKSCTSCDVESEQLKLVGNPPEPGKAVPSTAYSTVLLPDYFPVYAKLTHFTVFFENISPVHLQIWRQNFTDGTYRLMYSQQAVPDVRDTAQTVLVDGCMMVQPYDYLGFSDFSGKPTVAARHDPKMMSRPHVMKGSTNALPFTGVGLPMKFSVGAAYSTYDKC